MQIKTWQFLGSLVLASFATVLATVPPETWATLATLSLASGVSALALMAAAAGLGARWKRVEDPFGGLDRVYETHKWLGVWALVFASVHLVFKAGTAGWETAAILDMPPFYARLVRQLSFVGLMVIVLLALNRRIAYGTWRWWHKLSGPLFLVVVLHWLSFKSPIALASPAGVWLGLMSVLGVAGAFYKLLLYPLLSSHAEYRVVETVSGPSALRLVLAPVGQGVSFEPGQFAFLAMNQPGLREPHPFTIASAGGPHQPVQFVIRALGDYTDRLVREATVGMRAEVYAPFGRFKRPVAAAREVWVAGGVGISPFLAWLRDDEGSGMERVTLFNFYTPGREFPASEDIAALVAQRGAEYVPVSGGGKDPAFASHFGRLVRDAGAGSVQVRFCGPIGLFREVRARLAELGVPLENLKSECFDFR